MIKTLLQYLKILFLVFLSILILYELELLINVTFAQYLWESLFLLPHWGLIVFILMMVFYFLFASLGMVLFHFFKTEWKWPHGALLFAGIPALFPLFIRGTSAVFQLFGTSCVPLHFLPVPEFGAWVHFILWWAFSLFFGLYVLLNLSRKYALIWVFEFLVFLIYLGLFYKNILPAVHLPFRLFFW